VLAMQADFVQERIDAAIRELREDRTTH